MTLAEALADLVKAHVLLLMYPWRSARLGIMLLSLRGGSMCPFRKESYALSPMANRARNRYFFPARLRNCICCPE